MIVCSRKFENYSYSIVPKFCTIDKIKLIQFDGKFVAYVINGYQICGKGYELLGVDLGGSNFNNQNVLLSVSPVRGRRVNTRG